MNYQKGSTMGCLLVVFYSTIIFFFFKIFIKFKSQEKEIKLEIRRPDYLFAILRVVSSVNISYLRKKKKKVTFTNEKIVKQSCLERLSQLCFYIDIRRFLRTSPEACLV